MLNIGVCIETFFTDKSYEERLKNIHSLGFKNYEFWFHDKRFDGKNLTNENKDFTLISKLNKKYNLECTDFVFNHPDGGIVASLIDKKDHKVLKDNIKNVIDKAKQIHCNKLIITSGNKIQYINTENAISNMISILKQLAPICEKEDITLLLELFNTKVDHPDYFLDNPYDCINIIKSVNSPNVKMLFDIYHVQIMAGNITDFIRTNIEYIGHFHIAGVPGRNEPDNCELNYFYILKVIENLNYTGSIGLEYWPTVESSESLRRVKNYFRGLLE